MGIEDLLQKIGTAGSPLLALSLWVNYKLIMWIRDLYKEHAGKLEELVKAQQKDAEANRDAAREMKTSNERLSGTVQELRGSVFKTRTPQPFPAVQEAPRRRREPVPREEPEEEDPPVSDPPVRKGGR